MKKQKNSNVHTFKTGAIRDSQEGKECYIETISWTAMKRYASIVTGKQIGRAHV